MANSKKLPNPMADLLDEIGQLAAQSKHSCPQCKASLSAEAVLCIQCGYHLEKGKVLRTKRVKRSIG